MKHLVTLFSLAVTTAALLPLAAQDADPVQAPAAKTFADRQDCTVKLTVTRKIKGKDHSFEIPAVSLDGKGLLVASLNGVEANAKGLLAKIQMMGGDGDDEDGAPGKAKPDNGELTRVALLRTDATEAEADLVITDAALDIALIRVRTADGAEPPKMPVPPVAKDKPALLENVIAIERQSPEFQRVASAGLFQIAALVTTPRNFYIPSQPLIGGTAIYNLKGELLGVTASVHNECVIVPADAILKIAASADK